MEDPCEISENEYTIGTLASKQTRTPRVVLVERRGGEMDLSAVVRESGKARVRSMSHVSEFGGGTTTKTLFLGSNYFATVLGRSICDTAS